jgi:hypothetical protein
MKGLPSDPASANGATCQPGPKGKVSGLKQAAQQGVRCLIDWLKMLDRGCLSDIQRDWDISVLSPLKPSLRVG